MIAQHDVITTYMTQWDTHFVEPVVFGTTEPHGLAYSARCEHALNPNETIYPEGSSRSFLTQYRKGFLQNNQDIQLG